MSSSSVTSNNNNNNNTQKNNNNNNIRKNDGSVFATRTRTTTTTTTTTTSTNWDVSEYEMIHQYLLQHPTLSRNHIGIVSAINGLQQEWEKYYHRRRRQQEEEQQQRERERTKKGQQLPSLVTTSSTTTDHDWEDITKDKDHHDDMTCDDDDRDTTTTTTTTAASMQQQQQSTMIISTLAQHHITCSYPISAIAIVLHAVIMMASLPEKPVAPAESPESSSSSSAAIVVVKFICTGIPETTNHTGFAPPIRDLPMGQLVPSNWEEKNDLIVSTTSSNHQFKRKKIQFRYRKIIERGTAVSKGSYTLSVEEVVADDGIRTNLSITISPLVAAATTTTTNSTSKEASTPAFVIGLFDYINQQSWETAMKNISSTTTTPTTTNKKIPPFLHYKRLSQLIQSFVQHFHTVLSLQEDDTSISTTTHCTTTNDPFATHYYNAGAIKNIPPLTTTATTATATTTSSSNNYNPMIMTTPTPTLQPPPPLSHPFMVQNLGTSTTLPSGGHFDSDLHPTFGHYSPYQQSQQHQQQGPPGLMGNVMGPDHPIFTNGPWNNNDHNNNNMESQWNPTFGGGIPSMKPRFDPFGPPGGPTDVDPFQLQQQQQQQQQQSSSASKKRPPGGDGIPNNDLAIPPPFGGNNMFL